MEFFSIIENKRWLVKVLRISLCLLTLSGSAVSLASVSFPQIQSTDDADEVVENYPAYLNFVLATGRQTNAKDVERLEKIFTRLKAKDKLSAARFLRGLRFELVQKLELLGLSDTAVSSNHPAMRKWVAKYIPLWVRECDEYLFRAHTNSLAHR